MGLVSGAESGLINTATPVSVIRVTAQTGGSAAAGSQIPARIAQRQESWGPLGGGAGAHGGGSGEGGRGWINTNKSFRPLQLPGYKMDCASGVSSSSPEESSDWE